MPSEVAIARRAAVGNPDRFPTVALDRAPASDRSRRRESACQAGCLSTLDDSPESLFAKVAAGDEQAFAELYDQLAPKVYGLVLRVLRDPAQSAEVSQEVFLEIWKQAPQFDSERGTVQAWALTIAHRRAVDRVRAEQSSRDRVERVAQQDARESITTPAEAVAERFEQRQAAEALAALSDTHREVIVLAYYDGLTQQEIADRLGIPLGTVKTRARDGLAKLRARMGVER